MRSQKKHRGIKKLNNVFGRSDLDLFGGWIICFGRSDRHVKSVGGAGGEADRQPSVVAATTPVPRAWSASQSFCF